MKKITIASVILISSFSAQMVNAQNELARKDVIAVPGIDLKSVFRRLENAGFDP